MSKLSPQQIQEIITALGAGESLFSVSKRYNVDHTTILYHKKRNGIYRYVSCDIGLWCGLRCIVCLRKTMTRRPQVPLLSLESVGGLICSCAFYRRQTRSVTEKQSVVIY